MSIKTAQLESCSLTASDLREISPGVLKCPSLVFVDVSYNSASIGDEGCVEVARWIQGNTRAKKNGGWLTRIHLEGCGIGDVGAKTSCRGGRDQPKAAETGFSPELEHRENGMCRVCKSRERPPRDLDQGDYG